MRRPYSTGQTYERRAITAWLSGGGKTCPTTGQSLARDVALIPNMAIRQGTLAAH